MPRVSWTGAVAGEARAKFEAVRPKRRTGLAGGAGVCRSQRASCISSSAECTGSASVCWRVLSVKSWCLILRVTVRPNRSAPAMRSATRSAIGRSASSIASGALRSVAKVSSAPIDL